MSQIKQSRENNQKLNLRKLPAFLLLSFLLVTVFFSTPTHAADSLTVTSSGAQSINISSAGSDPTTGISTAISKDQITVSTTCRSGYNFTMSTSVNNNNLYLNGSSSNNTSGTYFSPASGSTALNSSANTWGYYYNADGTTPTASSTFSPVPALGSTVATIKTPLTTPSSTDISDEFSLYYGVAMGSSMPLGTYKLIPDTNNSSQDGTIVYYTTLADACISYRVSFSPTSIFNGTTLSGTGTMGDQVFYEGVPANLNSAGFTAPTGYYFAGWNTAQDGSGTAYTNEQQVTDLTTVGSTITLYAQWTDCPGGHICYDKNAGSDTSHQVIGTMGNQAVSSTATSITLLASNFSRDTYGFAGWSPDQTVTSSSKIYGPNEDITFTAGQYASRGLKLYAVWVASAGSIQDADTVSSVCSGLTKAPTDGTANLSSVSALTDQRDGQTYAVAKLADGNCWMIENLRLESTAEHNSDGTLAQGYGKYSGTGTDYGNFSGLAGPESANFSNSTTANSLYYSGTQEGTASVNIGTANYPGYRMPRYNNLNTVNRAQNNPNSNIFANNNTTGGMYSYGNYYTWAAAMANTTYYTGPTAQDADGKTSETVKTSLCPAGWTLPYGRNTGNGATSGGFSNLDIALGGTGSAADTSQSKAWRSYPNNFLYSGSFSTSSAYVRGSVGCYWSSTASDEYISYYLYLGNSYVYPGNDDSGKHSGHSIRCLAGS